MKQIFSLILIAVVFLAPTCKKETQLPDPELQKIFGKWSWVHTSGGFLGKSTTPESMHYSARVEFNKEDIYQLYKNDTLVARGKFSFVKKKSIHSNKDVWVMSFAPDTAVFKGNAPGLPAEVSFGGKDTLTLNEQVHDGFEYVYVRIK